jgi:hypothetical protein
MNACIRKPKPEYAYPLVALVAKQIPQRPIRCRLDSMKQCPIEASSRVSTGGQQSYHGSNIICLKRMFERIYLLSSCRQLFHVKAVSQLLTDCTEFSNRILNHTSSNHRREVAGDLDPNQFASRSNPNAPNSLIRPSPTSISVKVSMRAFIAMS